MAKTPKKKKSNKKSRPVSPKVATAASPTFINNSKLHCWILLAFSFVLYANTLFHSYTQDDAIVIYDNMYTQQGIQGIPGILQYDTFKGFFKVEGKDKLVSGGRYRPLTLVQFAIGQSLFGDSPRLGHIMNIFWYGLTCVILYLLLLKLLQSNPSHTNQILE